MDLNFAASPASIIRRELDPFLRQTFNSLPRQRLPNLAVGLSPRVENENRVA
jgi:hypothetical protein